MTTQRQNRLALAAVFLFALIWGTASWVLPLLQSALFGGAR